MSDSPTDGGRELGEIEDAVSFLDRAQKVCSDVSLLLNAVQFLALDFDPTQPFSQDSVRLTLLIVPAELVYQSHVSGKSYQLLV